MPQIIPIKELKNTNGISEMCKKTSDPIFVTKNGYGDMVIMSMKTYEERLAKLELYEQLALSEAQLKSGNVSDARQALSDLLRSTPLAAVGSPRCGTSCRICSCCGCSPG